MTFGLLMPGAGDAWRGRRSGGVRHERRGDALGEPVGNLALSHRRPILDRIAIDQMHGVPLAAEGAGARRYVVRDDPVAALALALGAGVGDDVLGLRGETDDQRRPVVTAPGDAGKDVRVLDKAQVRRPFAVFLQLLRALAGDPP